jgi:hypothetical protein
MCRFASIPELQAAIKLMFNIDVSIVAGAYPLDVTVYVPAGTPNYAKWYIGKFGGDNRADLIPFFPWPACVAVTVTER